MEYTPIMIIGTGAFIAFLIVTYYATKKIAEVQGYNAGVAKRPAVSDILDEPYHSYEVVFKNGEVYKFGGVKLKVKLDGGGRIVNYRTIIESSDNETLNDVEFGAKYNQSLRYVDYSEILYIKQSIQYHKYSV